MTFWLRQAKNKRSERSRVRGFRTWIFWLISAKIKRNTHTNLTPRPTLAIGFRANLPVIAVAFSIAVAIGAAGTVFFFRSQAIMEYQLQEKLRTTAAIGALQFDGDRLTTIRGATSMQSDALKDAVDRLGALRRNVPSIRFAYILRPTGKKNILEFVADADTFATPQELDGNNDGIVSPDEKASYPGDMYDASTVDAFKSGDAYIHPTVDQQVTEDQWGAAVSGYAPILTSKGKIAGVLGIDMNAEEYFSLTRSIFSPYAYLLLVLAGMFLTGYVVLYVWKRKVQALEDLDRERSAFMDLAFHQLGAPLATMQWWFGIVRENEPKTEKPENPEDDGWLQMERGMSRMHSILDALTQANDVWNDAVKPKPAPVALRTVIDAAVEAVKPQMDEKNQTIAVDCPKDLSITTDGALLTKVIREIVDNASAYSPKNASMSVAVRAERATVDIVVTDEGIGILTQDREHIFQKFMRGSNAATMKPVGNGIGLFVARGIMQALHGTVHMKNGDKNGSVFTVSLPVRS